jgi:hypothetical protein
MSTAATTSKRLTLKEFIARIMAMPDGPEKEKLVYYAHQKYGTASQTKKFKAYQFAPEKYIEDFLKWTPWRGLDAEKYPGQVEILQACAIAVKQQIEKRAYEKGELTEKELTCWNPDTKHPQNMIKNWIRVESGNGIGKTKSISGAVQWFFDCFESVVYTFSTSATQDKLTTWAEIGQDRAGKGLPGTLLQTQIFLSSNRFAISRSPSDSGGKGEEKTKGKHKEFLLFVIDEADGAAKFIFKAIETMASGGIAVVLMTANPRSRATEFHRIKNLSYVKTLRISTLYHPNVVNNQEVIPGAVMRDFVEKEIEKGCEVVELHNVETFTFDLPYDVQVGKNSYPAGTVFKPSPEFMTRVLGIAPPTSLDKTVISVGAYEAACKRAPEGGDKTIARVGVDGARSGSDKGTVYIHWQDVVWRSCELGHAKTEEYIDVIKTECLKLKDKGVTSLHIRMDTAYGSGVIDGLRIHAELKEAFEDYEVFEVHFGGGAYNKRDYDNVSTEMYYEAAETLKGISILAPPEQLEIDLCEREYKFINRQGKTRKILEKKEDFKKRTGRSPDDGDGLVMAIAPDYCFKKLSFQIVNPQTSSSSINKSSPLDNIMKRLMNKNN